MTFAAVPLTRSWGFDTSQPLTATQAVALKQSGYVGKPLSFLFRYVPLSKPSSWDVSITERDAILYAGWQLGLVQHVQYPGWFASVMAGTSHGTYAAYSAKAIEYPVGCHIALDLEGLGNSGPNVVQYVRAWSQAVSASGYKCLLYVGYDDGLTDAQMLSLSDDIDALWSDFGPRSLPAPLQFALKQHAQTTVAGIAVDPDECRVDNAVSLMALVPDVNVSTADPLIA